MQSGLSQQTGPSDKSSLLLQELPAKRNHFDIVVACEDEAGEDVDCPLVSIKFRN